MGSGEKKLQIKVGGLSCSFCAETIRKAYTRQDAVNDVKVSLAHEEVLVRYDPDKATEPELKQTLRQLGYTVRDPRKVRTFEDEEADLRRERQKLIIAAGFTGITALMMIMMWLGLPQPWFKWAIMGLALGTVFGPGRSILKMAVQSLRRGILNQHVLLEFGAFAGLIGGFAGFVVENFPAADFFAVAVFITTYHILSGFTSLKVRTRASQAVRKLLDLQPPMARVIHDGMDEEVSIEDVRVNDHVRVRPGEHIPVDGVVANGFSSVDESLVTGESISADKTSGDEVIGGSLNGSGTLVVRVTRIGEESFLQQVAHHIEEARALKPGIIQLVDKVLKHYVPGVLLFAVLGILIWTVGAWLLTGEINWARGVFAALAVLVMGYPCALGMATPLALIRGGGLAAHKGILMRSGEAFQVLKDTRTIVLDKTGTITKGEPEVVGVLPTDGINGTEILRLAASAENPSEHPLARAVVDHALSLDIPLMEVTQFQAQPGMGARAMMDGHTVRVGSLRYLQEEDVDTGDLSGKATSYEEDGKTVVAVAQDRTLLGLIAVADTLKEDASKTIRELKSAGLEPVMITGDNPGTARAVAEQVGIDKVMAGVLPDEKAKQVRRLQREGNRVAMVGDGINDGPALMQADVGIAIGAGTDIAIESADIVLIGDRLHGIVDAVHIGRSSYKKTVQNLSLAFSFNGIGVPLAVTGIVHPVWAMIAMVASVTTVLVNSFGGRLLPTSRAKPPAGKHSMVLNVPTIHCEGCVNTIRQALIPKVKGVEIEADLGTKILQVRFSSDDVAPEGIREILTEAGFKPSNSKEGVSKS